MRKIITTVLLLTLVFSLTPKAFELSVLDDKTTAQGFLDSYVCENVSISEWFVFSLIDCDCDFSNYINALDVYLSENEPLSVTSLKYALIYQALGVENTYTNEICKKLNTQSGIMYAVFSLHLLNNGAVCQELSIDDVLQFILQNQNSDGGWSVMKNSPSDIDVTAMALQAIAPHKDRAKGEITKALGFISSSQTENGGFKSYGEENAESSAQVIIALSSLQIDAKTDERFIKNGKTAFDSLRSFKTADGYSHLQGGKTNAGTTSQVFCAHASYEKYLTSSVPFYIFEEKKAETPIETNKPSVTDSIESNSPNTDDSIADNDSVPPLWRIIFICTVLASGIVLCIIVTVRKKTDPKNYLFIIICCAVLIFISFFINFSTPDSYYENTVTDKEITGTVTLTVSAESIGKGDIITGVTIPIHKGDTVFDVLLSAAKEYELVIGKSGADEYSYIQSINGISERQNGELSGWIYTVNGTIPSEGCGSYTVNDGDDIRFIYSTDGKIG